MQYNWQNKTILVVEDSETVNYFFEAALRHTHAKMLWAKTGYEALELCRENDAIDLVLMDLKLPEMDGYEATREIRKFRKDLPIIAQTAQIITNSKEISLKAGCNDYITKPIRLPVLLSILDKYLSLA